MNLTCLKEDLINNINIVSKGVSNKSTLPILECILLKTYSNGFKMTSNDLEIAINTALIPANIIEEGSIAIEAKIFSDIIRKLNNDTVTLSTENNNSLIINSGSSKFKIMGQNPEEFPEIPNVIQNDFYSLKQIDFKHMITQTIFSISADESKPTLTGELLEINNNSINLVAVDGYRISFRKTNVENSVDSLKVIIPGKTLREISKILSDKETEIKIYITDNHALFEFDENILVSRIIEGEFIKYDQTFSSEYKTLVTINRENFISALERVSLISRDLRKVPVKLEISQNAINLSAQTEMGVANEDLDVNVVGDDLKIAFNPRFLIDALKAIEDEEIEIHFVTSLSPCIIKPIEGDSYKYLVLPLRL